uniref:Uncharacterized protein n=1 Tax=Panagrolaimus sp. PS1159 TaxID=55785 RepID=A0AC35FW87_9BILA
MSDDHGCCGTHITSCAKLVAILGIIGSIFSIISAFFLWYYVPMAFVMLLTYIFVLVGINKEKPSYLLPCQIILGISLALNVLIVIGFIIIAIVVPNGMVESFRGDNYKNTVDEAKNIIRIGFFLFAFVVALASTYTIFAFTVIHKARKYLLCHLSSSR